MSIITLGEEKLKEVITINMAQEKLRRLNKFGWSIVEYMYTPQKVREKETWVCLWKTFKNYHIMLKH
jgi:hypothetical protein